MFAIGLPINLSAFFLTHIGTCQVSGFLGGDEIYGFSIASPDFLRFTTYFT